MSRIIFILLIFLFFSCSSESNETATNVKAISPTETQKTPAATSSKNPAQNQPNVKRKPPVRLGKAPVRLAMQEKIEKMHEDLMNQMETGFNKDDIEKYAKESEMYVSIYGDSLAAEYVFNAADLYQGIGEYKRALELWYLVYKGYDKKHPKAPHAMFQCGFTYDTVLERKDLAKTLYSMFLKSYPNHALASDVKILMKNLNKSPEDLVKEFQKKN
ncbi:MAG: hypothetical protein AAF573_20800 [Bacteroidota bacterium]